GRYLYGGFILVAAQDKRFRTIDDISSPQGTAPQQHTEPHVLSVRQCVFNRQLPILKPDGGFNDKTPFSMFTGIGYLTAVLDRCFAFNTGVVTPLQRVESKPDPGLAIPFKGGDIVSMQRAGLGPGVHLRFDTGAGKVSQHDPLPPTDKLLFSGGHTLSSKVPAGAMSPIGCGFYLAGGGR